MPNPQTQTIQLVFEPTLKVAGEVIKGTVQLNFPGLIKDKIEEVHVKLRGTVHTKITRQNSHGNTATDSQLIHSATEDVSLWSTGNGVYPPPGSDILELPFTFTLPSDLLPSCEFGDRRSEFVQIKNWIEVVGKRPGILRANQRIPRLFPVLPPSQSGAELREALQRGWPGPWRKFVRNKYIRKGLWGEYSEVEMALVLPEIDALPVFTPIPFTLTFITHSKVMKPNDKSSEDTIFPTPPLEPRAVEFWLESDIWVKSRTRDVTRYDEFIAHLGGLGTRKSKNGASVQVEKTNKVWIPAEGEKESEKGRWKQEITFKSTVQFSCAPTFTSETAKVSHKLKLKVNYAGIGNSHEAEIPIQIVSSLYPPGEQTVTWDGPPPEIDLPPDYFKGTWDEELDEKS